jgi:hypothetical protein
MLRHICKSLSNTTPSKFAFVVARRRAAGGMSSFSVKASSHEQEEVEIKRQINTAVAALSMMGPCRGVGDVYLGCVATSDIDMCRSVRADFEQCATTSAAGSLEILEQVGEHMLGHMASKEEKLLGVATLINLHNLSNLKALQGCNI